MNVKHLLKKIVPDFLKHAYHVGFLRQEDIALSIEERYSRVQWVKVGKMAKEGWFADPFILSVTDYEIVILVEEMVYKTGLGILAKLVIDRKNMSIKKKINILELDTHLSYPIYLQEDGKIFIYPENYQGGGVKVYEYDDRTEKITFVKEIIHEPLYDTQIVKIDSIYYLLGVRFQTGLQTDNRYLQIYKSESLLGDYKHIQTIENKMNNERGAGMIYQDSEGRYIRPTQCCEGGYGRCVILNELKLINGKFVEFELSRIEPAKGMPNSLVLHTFNQMSGVCVIDGFSWDFPKLVPIYKKIRGISD